MTDELVHIQELLINLTGVVTCSDAVPDTERNNLWGQMRDVERDYDKVKSLAPALPPDEWCRATDKSGRRCMNRRTGHGYCNKGNCCDFAPESKPTLLEDAVRKIAEDPPAKLTISERNQAVIDILDQAVLDDDDTVDPHTTVEVKPAKIDWVPRNSEPSPSGETHPNRFPYEPAPKPPPPPENETTTKGEPMPKSDLCYWQGRPDSPTCPARVPMTGTECKALYSQWLNKHVQESLDGVEEIDFHSIVRATEFVHGIKP